VDAYYHTEGEKVVEFERGGKLVCLLPTNCIWMLVRREAMSTLTTRDYLEKYYLDNQEVSEWEKVLKERYPCSEDAKIGFGTPPPQGVLDEGYR
jgi:hypothetical protein